MWDVDAGDEEYEDEGDDEGVLDEGEDEGEDEGDDEGILDEGYEDGARGRRRGRRRRRRGRGRRAGGVKPAIANALVGAEAEFALDEGSRPNQRRGIAAKVPGQPVGLIPASTAYEGQAVVSTSGIYVRDFLMSITPPGMLITKCVINDVELVKGDGVDGAAFAALLNRNQQVIAAAGRKYKGSYTITITWTNYNTIPQWAPPLVIGEQNTVCRADTTTEPIQGYTNNRRVAAYMRRVA